MLVLPLLRYGLAARRVFGGFRGKTYDIARIPMYSLLILLFKHFVLMNTEHFLY